jgi:hypothetical protein
MSDENTALASYEDEYEQFVDQLGTVASRHPRMARQLFRSVEVSVWMWIAFGAIAAAGTDFLEGRVRFPSLGVLVMYFVFQALLGLVWLAGVIVGLIGLSLLPDRRLVKSAASRRREEVGRS